MMVTDGAKGGLEPGVSEAQVAAIRRTEQKQAGNILGVADIVWLGFQDTEVPQPEVVRESLISLIREIRPDFVISLDPWLPYEAHPDHRRASMGVVEACLFAGLPMIQPEDLEHGLAPWQVTGIALALSPSPNTFIGIDSTWDKKIEALKCHKSQFPSQIWDTGQMQSTCPDAWLLNFTNPSGIVTEALTKHSQAKVFGLCNVPIGIKMGISQALEVEHERLSVDVSGLNRGGCGKLAERHPESQHRVLAPV